MLEFLRPSKFKVALFAIQIPTSFLITTALLYIETIALPCLYYSISKSLACSYFLTLEQYITFHPLLIIGTTILWLPLTYILSAIEVETISSKFFKNKHK